MRLPERHDGPNHLGLCATVPPGGGVWERPAPPEALPDSGPDNDPRHSLMGTLIRRAATPEYPTSNFRTGAGAQGETPCIAAHRRVAGRFRRWLQRGHFSGAGFGHVPHTPISMELPVGGLQRALQQVWTTSVSCHDMHQVWTTSVSSTIDRTLTVGGRQAAPAAGVRSRVTSTTAPKTQVRGPAPWSSLQHDGPNHLGLWCDSTTASQSGWSGRARLAVGETGILPHLPLHPY